MAWITLKSGKHVNTDWFNEDEQKRQQMQKNQEQAKRAASGNILSTSGSLTNPFYLPQTGNGNNFESYKSRESLSSRKLPENDIAFKMVEKGWEYQSADGKYTLKKDYTTTREKGDYASALLAPKKTVASWKVYSQNDPNRIHSFHSLKDAQDFVKEDMKKYNKESAPINNTVDPVNNNFSQYTDRTVAMLKKRGAVHKEEVEKYVRNLSDIRRNDLAKKMGIGGRGEEKTKQIIQTLKDRFDSVSVEPPVKKTPAKPAVKKEIVSNAPKNIPHKSNYAQYEDIIGERQEGSPIDRINACQENNLINPMYKKWQEAEDYEKYHRNCALCSTAGILQAQGYDVEALPRDSEEWRGLSTIFDISKIDPNDIIVAGTRKVDAKITYAIYEALVNRYTDADGNVDPEFYNEWNKYERMPTNSPQAAALIRKKMKNWGNGTAAQLSVAWQSTIRTKEGKLKKSVDAHALLCINENGKIYLWDPQSNEKHFNIEQYLKGSRVGMAKLVRVDNLPLKDGITDDLKKMVKRRKKKSLNEQIETALKDVDWSKF